MNQADDKDLTVEMEYTKENEYYCVVSASGNQIGSISNIGIRVCTQATELGYLCLENNTTYGYEELRNFYYEDKKIFLEEKIPDIKRLQGLSSEIDSLETDLYHFEYMFSDEELYYIVGTYT
jgi:hypothetical protein